MDNTKSTRWVSRVEIMEKLTSSEAQARFRNMSGAEAYSEFLLMVTGVPTYDLVPAGVCNGCWLFQPCDDNEELCKRSNNADCPCKIGAASFVVKNNNHFREATKMMEEGKENPRELPGGMRERYTSC